MKIKKYEWNGFGFPIIFEELPAVKLQGELVPDIDWGKSAEYFVRYICLEQNAAISGTQIKFIRGYLNFSLREFAKFLGVTHQSIMRWEKRGQASAQIESHMEAFVRTLIVKKTNGTAADIKAIFDRYEATNGFSSEKYKVLSAIHVEKSKLRSVLGLPDTPKCIKKSQNSWTSSIQHMKTSSLKVVIAEEEKELNFEVNEEDIYEAGSGIYSGMH